MFHLKLFPTRIIKFQTESITYIHNNLQISIVLVVVNSNYSQKKSLYFSLTYMEIESELENQILLFLINYFSLVKK